MAHLTVVPPAATLPHPMPPPAPSPHADSPAEPMEAGKRLRDTVPPNSHGI